MSQVGDCPSFDVDLDWYRQRGDRMESNQLLPNTVSFVAPTGSRHPAGGNPCDESGGGGGDREPSCLSDFGFDPDDYWVVFDMPAIYDPTKADLFIAEAGSYTAIADDAIDTSTACDVSIHWANPYNGQSATGLFDFFSDRFGLNVQGNGLDTMELAIAGLGEDGQAEGALYFEVICGGAIGLEVSDGINDYYIVPPPCEFYQFEATMEYVAGVSLTYSYEDPWGRTRTASTDTSNPSLLVQHNVGVIAEPQSPVRITFNATGVYSLWTSSDSMTDCASLSGTTPVLDNAAQNATTTWDSADPNPSVLFCTKVPMPD